MHSIMELITLQNENDYSSSKADDIHEMDDDSDEDAD